MTTLISLYALLIFAGGLIGYFKAGSAASLTAGLIFGALIGSAAVFMRLGYRWGGRLALLYALVLTLFFAFRFLKTGAFMPAGLMALVSLAVAGALKIKGGAAHAD